jgi:hypothetical protein
MKFSPYCIQPVEAFNLASAAASEEWDPREE